MNIFSEMVRAVFLITCLLLTILGECLARKAPSTKNYNECFLTCKTDFAKDCKSGNVNKAVYCGGDSDLWCQESCDYLQITLPDDKVEEDEQEDDDLKKRELDELKLLIGV
jgi:hypothetical protein